MKITKRQLRRIIKEEKRKLLNEGTNFTVDIFSSDDLYGLLVDSLVHWTMETNLIMDRMAERYGELVSVTTGAVRIANEVEDLANNFDNALNNMLKEY